eukprot:gene6610-10115_t
MTVEQPGDGSSGTALFLRCEEEFCAELQGVQDLEVQLSEAGFLRVEEAQRAFNAVTSVISVSNCLQDEIKKGRTLGAVTLQALGQLPVHSRYAENFHFFVQPLLAGMPAAADAWLAQRTPPWSRLSLIKALGRPLNRVARWQHLVR